MITLFIPIYNEEEKLNDFIENLNTFLYRINLSQRYLLMMAATIKLKKF